MDREMNFAPKISEQIETDPKTEAQKDAPCVEIDKVAEDMLDKYAVAFSELAK